MSANPLSPPPKFFGNLGQAPVTERDWDQFYRWLFSLWRQVEQGENPSPPIPPLPPVVSAEAAITETLARIGGTPQPPAPQSSFNQLVALIQSRQPQQQDNTLAYQALTRVVPPFPVPGAGSPLLDTYANWTATNYPPEVYNVGTPFVISTWNVVYCVRLVGGVPTWVYETGIYIAAFASRPTTGYNGAALGTNDTGLTFLGTDTLLYYYWSGAAWVPVTPAMGGSYPTYDLNGTFPNPPLNTTGVTAATYGDSTHVAQITIDAKGRISAASDVAISASATTGTFTPGISFGGGTTGITYSSQTGRYWKFSGMVIAFFDVTLSNQGSSTGSARVTDLPFASSATFIATGVLNYADNMNALQSGVTVYPDVGTVNAYLMEWKATGSSLLDETHFSNTSRIVGTAIYYS